MKLNLNFASREYVLLRKLYASLGAGLGLCAAVFAFFYLSHLSDGKRVEELGVRVKSQEAAFESSEKALAEYAHTVDAQMISSTYTEAEFANAAIDRRVFSWTLFLGRIEDLVPRGVGITGIKPDFKTLDVDISGTAKDMESLTEFLERLTGSEYFSDIPPSFQTSEEYLGKDIGKTVQRFNFKLRYIPNQDAAAGETAALEEG